MVYTEEQLKKYSIYQLRFLSRNVGVRSPTTKKRDELIKGILEIQSGRGKPYYPANSKGRPAKSCFLPLDGEVNFVYGVCGSDIKGDVVFNKNVSKYNESELVKVEGFVLENNYQYFLVGFENSASVERIAHLSKEYIELHGIREGSKLTCEAKYNREVQMLNVVNILTVDGCKFDGKERPNFEEEKIIFDKEKINLAGNAEVVKQISTVAPLCYGDRALIIGDKRGRLSAITLPVATSMPKDVRTIVVALNETPERIALLKDESQGKFELFHSTFSDNPNLQYFALKVAISYVKRLVESGRNVALVIPDLEDVYPDKLDREALYSIKSFFAMARRFEKQGSCTVIGGCSSEFIEQHKDFGNFMNVVWVEENKELCEAKSVRQEN